MKKVKHVNVISKRYKNDHNIFKLSRNETEVSNIYQIQGSYLDKSWTESGLEILATLDDNGNDAHISVQGEPLNLGYDGLEELHLLLNYYAEHTNSRDVNCRIRSKK